MESKLTIKLPDTMRRQAHAIAALRGETVSEVVRVALRQYIEQAQGESKALGALYAEFAEEDRELAGVGLGHYNETLRREENQA